MSRSERDLVVGVGDEQIATVLERLDEEGGWSGDSRSILAARAAGIIRHLLSERDEARKGVGGMQMDNSDRRYRSPREAAAWFGVSESAILRWIREGRLEATKLGRTIRIDSKVLEKVGRHGLPPPKGKEPEPPGEH
jgi:excisionase family DNA binding protein